ncbi:MAG: hypothetical protein L3J82_03435 [Planctomycetes bacterium]|nr:hypothetical protein [Planctomycetota bacterium]
MRTLVTLSLMVMASLFAQGVTAQTVPVAALGAGSDFSATSAVLYEITMNPGDSFSSGVIEFTDAGTGDIMTLTNTANPALSGLSFNDNGPATSPAILTLTFSGTLGAVASGASDYTFDCVDNEGAPNTLSITVRVTVSDVAPTHTSGAGIASGDGLGSGTAYTTNDQAKGSTTTIALASIIEPNGTALSFTSATPGGGNPSTVFDGNIALTGVTAAETLQVLGFTALADADVGTHSYTVIVSDGTNPTTLFLDIVVVNAAPVLADPANGTSGQIVHGGTDPTFTGTATVGDNLALDFVATDGDAADSMTITATVTSGTLTGTTAGFGTDGPFTSTPGVSPNTLNLTGTAALAGTITFTIVVDDASGTGNATDTYTLALTISAAPAPVINLGGSLTAFSTTGVGIASPEQSYTVGGANLTADIVITPPTGFQIGITSGVLSTSAINLTPSSGTVGSTTIFVAYNPPTAGGHSGNISHTSAGASAQNQAVSGSIAGGSGQVTFAAAPTHPGGAQTAGPGNSRTALVFRLTETAGSSFDLTAATVSIAMTNNGSGVAAAAVASVSISRGGALATITNGGTGWSANASTITLSFTFSASTIAASTSGDFAVTISFVGGSAPKPAPGYIASLSNLNLTGSGTVTNTLTVTGGQITLNNTLPDDPFAEEDDENSCSLSTNYAPSWPLLLILMMAGVSIAAIKRRKA